MLLLNGLFRNYEEFKVLFVAENGRRKNKLLLQFAKHRIKTRQPFTNWGLYLPDTENSFTGELLKYHRTKTAHHLKSQINYIVGHAKTYSLDESYGICEDGDARAIRYIKEGRTYKMKTGKFLRAVFAETGALQYFGDAVCNAFFEQFAERWERENATNDLEFVMDTDFAAIYDSGTQDGDFHSCMNNEPYTECYKYIDCKAVSLRKGDTIHARALLFNAHTEDGTIVRYLDRQYSSKDILKKRLIDVCIEKNLIDAYRKAGAGCSDCTEIYSVLTREKLEDTLYIDLSRALDLSEYFPYFDTFKYLNFSTNEASNDENDGDCSLTETDGTHPRNRNYDEYNDEYTSDDIVQVNVWFSRGECYQSQYVAENYASNNFGMYEDEYYDAMTWSDVLGEYLPNDRVYDLEDAYKERNWNWDSVNEEYTEDDTISVNVWNKYTEKYDTEYTSEDYAETYFEEYDGEYYDVLTHSDVLNEAVPNDKFEELEQEYKEQNWNWDSINQEYTEDDIVDVYLWNDHTNKYDTECASEYYALAYCYMYDGKYYDDLTYSNVLNEDVPNDRLEELESEILNTTNA